MDAMIFDVKHFAVHDGPGIRTTVFLKGCPLSCVWCHNPEGLAGTPQLAYMPHKCLHCGACTGLCDANTMQNRVHRYDRARCVRCGKCTAVCSAEAFRLYGRRITTEDLLKEVLEDKIFYEASGGGVTLSGGECLLQPDFCAEFLQLCRQNGLHTAVDTCGFVPRQALEKVIPYTNIFLYDLKAIDEGVHRRCTGQSNSTILDNLRYLDACGCRTELRVPYVPGCNDDQIGAIGSFAAQLSHTAGVRLLKYHRFAAGKYTALGLEEHLPPALPTEEEMTEAVKLLRRQGISVLE